MNNQKFKADKDKARPDLLEEGFPRALRLVQATLEYGAKKYKDHGWVDVPDALVRYSRAARRHRQARDLVSDPRRRFFAICDAFDEESGLPHIAHEIVNLLIVLELELRSVETPNRYLQDLLDLMNDPPHEPDFSQEVRE